MKVTDKFRVIWSRIEYLPFTESGVEMINTFLSVTVILATVVYYQSKETNP